MVDYTPCACQHPDHDGEYDGVPKPAANQEDLLCNDCRTRPEHAEATRAALRRTRAASL